MKVFAVLLLVGAAAALPTEKVLENSAKNFKIFGAVLNDEEPSAQLDGVLRSERLGWRSVYEKPFFMAVKQDNKPELAAFFVKDGLSGLAKSSDMRFLHDLLRNGVEKRGFLMSAAKFVDFPEVSMPVTKMFMPKDFTFTEAASLYSDNINFPWMLVVERSDAKALKFSSLALVGDMIINEDSIKVASDEPAALISTVRSSGMLASRSSLPLSTAFPATYPIHNHPIQPVQAVQGLDAIPIGTRSVSHFHSVPLTSYLVDQPTYSPAVSSLSGYPYNIKRTSPYYISGSQF